MRITENLSDPEKMPMRRALRHDLNDTKISWIGAWMRELLPKNETRSLMGLFCIINPLM